MRVHGVAAALPLHISPRFDNLPARLSGGQRRRPLGELRRLGSNLNDRGEQILHRLASPFYHRHIMWRRPPDHLMIGLRGPACLPLKNFLPKRFVNAVMIRDRKHQERRREDRPDVDFHFSGHRDLSWESSLPDARAGVRRISLVESPVKAGRACWAAASSCLESHPTQNLLSLCQFQVIFLTLSMRSGVAGCVAKNPPPLVPSACISQLKVSPMIC